MSFLRNLCFCACVSFVAAVPENIESLISMLPEKELNDEGNIDFNVPAVIANTLSTEPYEYLSGACLQTYEGYSDGGRLSDFVDLVGEETYDFIVEYAIFDFVTGYCKWIADFWNTEENGWIYEKFQDSGVFTDIEKGDAYATLLYETVAWVEYWLSEEAKAGNLLYTDTLLDWQTNIISKFLSLKTSSSLVSDYPQWDELILPDAADEGDELNKKQKKLKKKKKQKKLKKTGEEGDEEEMEEEEEEEMDMEEEEEALDDEWSFGEEEGETQPDVPGTTSAPRNTGGECRAMNPVEFFGERWSIIARYLKLYHHEDIDGSHHHEGLGLITRFNIIAEACEGVCIRIGAGFTWDLKGEQVCMNWNYGMGSYIDRDTSVKVDVSFFCQNLDPEQTGWEDVVTYGVVTGNDVEYNLIFRPTTYEFIGIGYRIPFGASYSVTPKADVNFYYLHSGKIACLAEPYDFAQEGDDEAGKAIKPPKLPDNEEEKQVKPPKKPENEDNAQVKPPKKPEGENQEQAKPPPKAEGQKEEAKPPKKKSEEEEDANSKNLMDVPQAKGKSHDSTNAMPYVMIVGVLAMMGFMILKCLQMPLPKHGEYKPLMSEYNPVQRIYTDDDEYELLP